MSIMISSSPREQWVKLAYTPNTIASTSKKIAGIYKCVPFSENAVFRLKFPGIETQNGNIQTSVQQWFGADQVTSH